MELTGKVAIVTGGTKGIGRAIAETLVNAGVNVSICGRREDELHKAVSDLNRLGGGEAIGTVCDVRNYDEITALFEHTVQTVGGLDILVNNAGMGIFTTVEDMSPEDFRAVLETNVFGVFYCCHQAIPLMKKRGGGYIINISSPVSYTHLTLPTILRV